MKTNLSTRILLVLSMLMLAAMACTISVPNIPAVKVGELTTVDIAEDLPETNGTPELVIETGAAELTIASGGSRFVEGTVDFNVTEWVPTVTHDGNRITISQTDAMSTNIPTHDVINRWDLKLGGSAPFALTINAGAYEGDIDLTGLPLTHFEINDGASDVEVFFGEPNTQTMDELIYNTGASNVKLSGLANANFERMSFSAGAGSYTLDFSGELQRDADVDITGGVSNTKIIIPEGVHAVVEFTTGMSNIETEGTWTIRDGVYEMEGEGPVLTINIEVGAGNIELVQD